MKLELSETIIKKALHSHANNVNCFACPLLCVPKSKCHDELLRNARERGIPVEEAANGA